MIRDDTLYYEMLLQWLRENPKSFEFGKLSGCRFLGGERNGRILSFFL